MKRKFGMILAFLLALPVAAVRARSQSPSPNPVTWTLTPGTVALSTWTQILYVATVPSLTSNCPPPGTLYKYEGATLGNATSISDALETPGTFVCLIDQESLVSGGETYYSAASGIYGPFQIPGSPGVVTPTNRQPLHPEFFAFKNGIPRPTRPGTPKPGL